MRWVVDVAAHGDAQHVTVWPADPEAVGVDAWPVYPKFLCGSNRRSGGQCGDCQARLSAVWALGEVVARRKKAREEVAEGGRS